MKKKNILATIFVMFAVFIFVAGFATAVETQNNTDAPDAQDKVINGEALNVRYDHLVCKVDLTNAQIDSINKYIAVDLSNAKDTLTADMNQLSIIKASGNKTAFDTFVTTVLKSDFDNATKQIQDIKKNFKTYNLTNDTRTAYKTDLKSELQAYSTCVSNENSAMAKVMVKHYEHAEEKWADVISKFDKKNITSDQMKEVRAEMQAKLLELQAAINSTNTTQIKAAMKDINQEHLHLWARFEEGKIQGYMKKLGPMAEKYNLTDNLNAMNIQIDKLKPYITPGYKFQEGDAQKVWSQLKDANKDLQNTSKDILNQARTEMKQQKEDMKQQRDEMRQQRNQTSDSRKNVRDDMGRGPKNNSPELRNTSVVDENNTQGGN